MTEAEWFDERACMLIDPSHVAASCSASGFSGALLARVGGCSSRKGLSSNCTCEQKRTAWLQNRTSTSIADDPSRVELFMTADELDGSATSTKSADFGIDPVRRQSWNFASAELGPTGAALRLITTDAEARRIEFPCDKSRRTRCHRCAVACPHELNEP